MKHACCQCSNFAIWWYQPSTDGDDKYRYYCDDHIDRGCSCNIEYETGEQSIDDKGRLLPCCEYYFDEDGFSNE